MRNIGDIIKSENRCYRILSFLGKGANTAAYLAECTDESFTGKCILKECLGDTEKFINSAKMQNRIRQLNSLNNQTPPVSHIFKADEAVFADIACYSGNTLDRLENLSLSQYMELCLTIAKTVRYYHDAGYLCLDIKPENIFVMQNSPDDILTQLVEFIDFDSIHNVSENNLPFSYTREWAAPEQLNPYSVDKIGFTTDIYTIGEMVFFALFGRHSDESEHRGFSKFRFEECRQEYRKIVERPDVCNAFTRLFHGTIRTAPNNRFQNISEVISILSHITETLYSKEYVIPVMPSVSPIFVGRENELKQISDSLKSNPVLFVTGIGGIGKSTIVRNFIVRNKSEYEVIVYLEYEGNIRRTFADDSQLQISTLSRQENESIDDYFDRKLSCFKRICGSKRVLFILDNFTDRISKNLRRITDCGYDTVIVTRNRPPINSFPFIEIHAVSDKNELFRLISLNSGKTLTKEEKSCFDEIITLVNGHTLVLELIARQISAGRLDINSALMLIRENGFSRFSFEKIGNYKDGEEVYDSLSAIIKELFTLSSLNNDEKTAMKILALLDVRGLETELVLQFFKGIKYDTVLNLAEYGWIYHNKKIQLHPVIAETLRNHSWNTDDITVMEHHQKIIDIYVGMANHEHIQKVIKEAEQYKNYHQRHIIKGMYYDMLAWYYDTVIDGKYVPYNEDEAKLVQKLIDYCEMAIDEYIQSTDSHRIRPLINSYLSLAGILIRSTPDYFEYAEDLLDDAYELIEENENEISECRCYFFMTLAWYYTLAEPDIAETKALTEKAEKIAVQIIKTDLELIDIIYIPTANVMFYHNDFKASAEKIKQAIMLCRKHSDMIPYIDKQAELSIILIEIYLELKEYQKCRELICEIERINEKYSEQGIYRKVSDEIRKQL